MSFSASDNKITGTIPPWFCNASMLQVLNLSNNSLHGRIPSCLLGNLISVLNLRRNNLEGEIPDTFPTGCLLETLDLSWNVLEGKVPKSLTRCSGLHVLNLGNNQLHDAFPCWLKTMSKLRVLVMRFNLFRGNISCLGERNMWPNLQIVDFASDNVNDGVIPADMFRFLQMLIDGDSSTKQLDHLHYLSPSVADIYYQDSVTVTLKGQNMELQKILTIFTSVDFSNNHLHGLIPNSIGEAKSLYLLNLSHNALSGHIPSTIGNLSKLESLDLSFNTLDEEIPKQLAELTFLSFLNLSYNHLVGRIPQGSQFQTFPESSFIGNDGLCGFPLNKTCGTTAAFPQGGEETEEENVERDIYVSAALGFVVGLGFIFGPLLFCKRWRRWHNKIVSRLISWVLPQQDHHQLEDGDW